MWKIYSIDKKFQGKYLNVHILYMIKKTIYSLYKAIEKKNYG